MKKYTITISLLLKFLITIGQTTTDYQNYLELISNPNLKRVTADPQAEKMSQYQAGEVDNANGTLGTSIPIHTIPTNSLSLPISISYDHSGIVVNSRASCVGLNWSLSNGGGIITKEVHGKDDDLSPEGFNHGNNATLAANPPGYLNPPNCNDEYFEALQLNRDLMPDIYSFSLLGQSYHFMYDKDEDRFYTSPNSDYRILRTQTSPGYYNFNIIDPSGNQFLFEQSAMSITFSDASDLDFTINHQSQWYLTKIVNPNGYTEATISYILDDQIQSVNNKSVSHMFSFGSAVTNPNLSTIGYTIGPHTVTKSSSDRLISTISTDFEDVEFHYSTRLDESYKLDNVEIKNKQGSLKEKIIFDYSYYGTTVKRLKLDNVKFYDKSITLQKKFDLDYYSGILPDKESNSIDLWGYYNGAGGNSMIPKIWCDQYGDFVGNCDRTPHFQYGVIGMLKSITYPTGGKTEFEYEQNTYGYISNTINPVLFQNGTGSSHSSKPFGSAGTDSHTFDLDNSGPIEFTITASTCDFNQSSLCNNPDPVVFTDHIQIIDPNNIVVEFNGLANSAQWCQITSQVWSYQNSTVQISGVGYFSTIGTYQVKAITSSGTQQANIYVTYPTFGKSIEAGGLRIKKTSTYDGFSSSPIVKIFDYSDPSDLGRSSGVIPNDFVFVSQTRHANMINSPLTCPITNYFTDVHVSSDPLLPIRYSTGNSVTYKNVKVINGNFGEGGSTLFTFSTVNDLSSPFLPSISQDYKRGKVESIQYYNNFQNLVKTVQNQYYFSNYSTAHTIYGCNGKITYFCPIDCTTDDVSFYSYNFKSQKTYLSSVSESEFFPGTSSNPLVSIKTYSQDNSSLNQITKTTVTNSDGATQTNYIRYPIDYSPQLSFTDPIMSALYKMLDRNMVAVPIESYQTVTRSGVGEKLVGSSITTFKEYSTGKIYPYQQIVRKLTQPDVAGASSSQNGGIFTLASGGNFKTNLEFLSYNGAGNPTSVLFPGNKKYSLYYKNNPNLVDMVVYNADQSQIFFDGFENNGNVTTNYKYGKKAHQGQLDYFPVPVTQGDYNLCYWKLNGTNWEWHQSSLTIPFGWTMLTAVNAGTIDDLRIFPKNAKVEVFHYDSDYRKISSSKNDGLGVKFDYDDFGRLKLIRNDNDEIIKKYQIGININD